jgi:mannose-1-phosphate guanylyltransferase
MGSAQFTRTLMTTPLREIWSIALAAGAGKRLMSVTGGIPKQFWRPAGGASLLEHTLDRLYPITGPSRTVTIVDEPHRAFVAALDRRRPLGQVVYQPQDRGTVAGVLLPLLRVLTDAPDAIVVITAVPRTVRGLRAPDERSAIQILAQSSVASGGIPHLPSHVAAAAIADIDGLFLRQPGARARVLPWMSSAVASIA